MNNLKTTIKELRTFLILWMTQSLSSLGSSMTNFALVIWSYQARGSALTTALLAVCSYAPYVLMSIFAGALSDRWNKKVTMLVSDTFAALCTVAVLVLLKTGYLEIGHLYLLNALNGLMNTIQQPASDVAVSLVTPKEYYQKISGLRSFSNSGVSILTPVAAAGLFSLAGIEAVILFDFITFSVAFISLLKFVKIPDIVQAKEEQETVWQSAKSGLIYLKQNRGILDLILFLAAINLVASAYEAALPAMLLSKSSGGEGALGIVNAVAGVAMLTGSVAVSIIPAPKSRVRVICNALLLSMGTENFLLAFGTTLPIWCIGAALGWIGIPLMSANMDVLFRSHIPLNMQGRVYSARNTLQFFTIPIGYLAGGILVDYVFEPFMRIQPPDSIWIGLFGTGKGAGAAMFFMVLGFAGVLVCLVFQRDSHIWKLERK